MSGLSTWRSSIEDNENRKHPTSPILKVEIGNINTIEKGKTFFLHDENSILVET